MQRNQCKTLAALLLFAAAALASAQYRILDRWAIGGDGRWDYLTVDSPAHRLYIARGARVEVVDTTSGKLIGSIPNLHGTHGIALDPAGKLGFISDGAGNAVVVFDRATLAVLATVPVGTGPDGIVYEPLTSTVWAFNGKSKNATVVDAASFHVLDTVALPGKPETPVTDGKGHIYANTEDTGLVVSIDVKTRKVLTSWKLSGCEGPTGLALDIVGERLFSTCDHTLAVSDARLGKQIAKASIGDGPDAAGFNAAQQLVFSANGEGTLSVVDASNSGYPTVQTLATRKSARTMAYDAATDRVYTVAASFGPAPAPTAEVPRPRPPVLPGSFEVIVIGR